MSWTCPGHYKVHVHGRDSPGRPVHGHCPIPLPALSAGMGQCPKDIVRTRTVRDIVQMSASHNVPTNRMVLDIVPPNLLTSRTSRPGQSKYPD